MTKLDLTNDFQLLDDDTEAVTLCRRNSNNELFVEIAKRQQVTTQQANSGEGHAIQADAVWHLQLPLDEQVPQIGDVILDQQKNRWTILQSQSLFALGRCKCTTRELRLAYGCHQLVDAIRPVWDDLGSGPEVVEWTAVCDALPVSIRLDEMIADWSTTPPTKQLIYEFVLSEMVPLEPDDRLIDEHGNSYRLQSLTQAARIDRLPIAEAIREEAP